jgi:hypothetical protein
MECNNASQAAVRRGFDEKSGERRGDQLQIANNVVACFRKIFAAKLPELMPANHRSENSSNQASVANQSIHRQQRTPLYPQPISHSPHISPAQSPIQPKITPIPRGAV